ncbi:E3 ubiquitin-protein ligase RNF8 isoform X3 [Ahaetulla prasina]|uniref:E3 ubiquitin-protein ligase RNF8 isoform X3 n=1 Tax=Ahaetulla prasina TaxID=499056 RepID=UPI002648E073|nr:E3 ubiquitin-protein ligase RNF8 isoform X3 [Ahaetulla prasina]
MAECFGGDDRISRPSGWLGQAWCLRRVGMNEEWLLLEDGSEVTIGRGGGVTYQLTSKSCPLMISRNHCIFKQNASGQWTVMDNKSLNGVWLNCERIDPSRAYVLQEGDFIQLGVPLKHKETAEYEYTLIKEERKIISPFLALKNDQATEKVKDRSKRKISLEESETSGAEGPSHSRSKRDRASSDNDSLGKTQEGSTDLSKPPTENTETIVLLSSKPSKKEKKKNHCNSVQPDQVFLISKEQKTPSLEQSWNSLEQVIKTLEDMTKLKAKVQEKQTAVLTVKQKPKFAPKEIQVLEQELQQLQEQLCTEQQQQQQQVEQLEKTVSNELQTANEEHGEERLKDQLAQVLLQEEKEKARAQKEEALSQMNDVLENELQCTICSEHFIEAVTLNCAHSFCSYCIDEWMKRKVECPICRGTILSKTRSLVLDNCIDRMVENLDAETKRRRLSLIQERKGKRIVPSSPPSDSESSSLTSSSDSESSSLTSTLDSESSSLPSMHSLSSTFTSSSESDDYDGDSDSPHVI